MRLVSCLALLAACGACGGPSVNPSPVSIASLSAPPPPMPIAPRDADPAIVRVMSYNLNFGVAGDPDNVEAVATGKADIVVFQESNDAWAATLTAAFPHAHARFAPPDTQFAAGGMGILSNYPIVSVTTLPHPKDDGLFYAWRIVVDVRGTNIQILNVHLRPPMSDGGSWIVGYFSTRETRGRELAWQLAQLDPKMPAIVAGDFNEEADGLAVSFATDRGFTDAIAQYAGTRPSWHWPVGNLTLKLQLDHLLYDRHFEPRGGGIVDGGHSDHQPVWADLELLQGS